MNDVDVPYFSKIRFLFSLYCRGYYRCTHRGTQGCLATKQVQKADADPSTMVVTYRGEHTCSQVLQLARSSALSLAKQASTGNKNATREAEKPKASQEMSFSFGAGLRVKTEDLDTREDDIFPSFSFPSTPIEPENVGDHIFCATLMENDLMDSYSPTFASPAATFEPDYLQATSSFGLGLDYVQTSESGLSEIISAPTSVTNSPIGDFGFSLDDLDFHHFENLESFAYES